MHSQIDGRKLLTYKKSTWQLNHFFLYDTYENIKSFNTCYLSMLTDVDDSTYEINSEYNIGFNNIDFMYEKELINIFMKEEMYLIIRPKYQVDDISQVYSLFNKDSKDYIENNYSVIFKDLSKIPTYIIKIESVEEVSSLKDYIYGYLFNPIKNNDIQLNDIISFNNLMVLDLLMDIWEIIIFRSTLYSNYNLTIYTRAYDKYYLKARLNSYSKICYYSVSTVNIKVSW